jgi:alkanesulfonate monooxygenase SsuD/methylene tetrahydromethanopterin reductase-like flavin-dependent oxidoreductase (luciferase family)
VTVPSTPSKPPRFGFIFDFSAPSWTGTAATWWPQLVELAGEVEDLGYDTIWSAEHHFATDTFSASPLLMLGPLAATTTRITLGTYVLLMPLHHPLRVAEECAAIDIFTRGRLELGLGIGFRQEELDGFAIPRNARRGILEDSIEIIRRAWQPGSFEFHGNHFSFDSLDVTPKPVQDEIPLWLAARDAVPARRAGRVGAHLHLLGGRTIRQAYEDELVAHGLAPGDYRVSVFKPIFVAEDPARELDRYRDHFEYFTNRHATWVGTNRDVAYDAQIQAAWGNTVDPLSGMSYLHGTPSDCLAQLRALYQRKPFTDLIAPITPPYDIEGVRRSIRLFATEVMAPFKREIAGPAAATQAG